MNLDNKVWKVYVACLSLADENIERNKTDIPCKSCGNSVTVLYHESRLYSVCCTHCNWVRLQEAKSPSEAAEKAIK